MADTRTWLVEIGTEEMPPKALAGLAAAFEQGIKDGLDKAELTYGECQCFATPRRLALRVHDLPMRQADRRKERRGPALGAAFDANGQPTQAALGFARSCGVSIETLGRLETDKGAWLIHVGIEPGNATAELLPGIAQNALNALPIPKRMHWADRDDEFVRPVQWVVLLWGDEVLPASLLGVPAGRETRGHRFHHPDPIPIADPQDYAQLLRSPGRVIADFNERKQIIKQQAVAAATSVNGCAIIEPELLDEVTALVEWPVAILGNFERRFLDVPPEVLITTMQDNQRYFPVKDAGGQLMPHFITIANLESKDVAQVREGNERVIRPRFSDAEFFWLQDCKQTLGSHYELLKSVIFQHRLGSLYDKSERLAVLARHIAEHSGGNPDWAEHAARLAKCDLLSQMVQEFPELQGIMGRYYAQHDGEAPEVAQAIREQYLPRYAGDELPTTATGRAIALADRLDTLMGIFAIGQIPSGASDPFALRRAALGVLRILIEGELALDLRKLLTHAARHFDPTLQADTVVEPVFDYILERLRGYYLEKNFSADSLEAVLACQPACPLDFDRRLRAVAQFRQLPEAASLAAANKRIRNILKSVDDTVSMQIRPDLLSEAAEQTLAGRLAELSAEVIPMMEAGSYSDALTRLAALRESVDGFFDQVLVMVDDPTLRENRLALLNELGGLFLRVADFSRLQN
ncbi:MAG: glycine--tRNA ligase subunit beta [Gammaproteobacteria bacterium]|nr:glycine--tRNA ligase subunit beta [Gammaproteobacteria bacterium]MCP5424436.1 glycine--tRNA ligase subunit beta [Gammaproteobacteria bacterium]MCP5458430.1 glycine--tRNA ligase subunit beta [Gammaproteobacteria bacterium]